MKAPSIPVSVVAQNPSFQSHTGSILTPSSLSSEFQFPFKERWIPKLDNKVRAKLTKLEEGEDAEEETEDPANHPEWFDRRNKIDPGWEDR